MKKKTFASLSQSRHEGSLGKPLALIALLGVLFVLAATQTHAQDPAGRISAPRVAATPGAVAQAAHDRESHIAGSARTR
jgi:hypothetical protein